MALEAYIPKQLDCFDSKRTGTGNNFIFCYSIFCSEGRSDFILCHSIFCFESHYREIKQVVILYVSRVRDPWS